MERHSVFISALLICAVAPALTRSVYSSLLSGERKETFKQHFHRVRSFKCAVPRATAVSVYSLLKETLGFVDSSNVYLPPETVLHRCDAGAGCCLNPRRTCGMADSRPVNLTFHVTYVIDTPDHPRGSASTLVLQADNHTRCHCVDI